VERDDSSNTALIDEIAPSKTKGFIARWWKLRSEQAGIDYEIATLASEIASEFPDTPNGRFQFRAWLREHFEIRTARARRLQEAAKGIQYYPDAETWRKIGGWPTIGFLLGFKTVARNKIFKETLKTANESEHGTVTVYTARRIAADLNLVTERKVGRPTRTTVEAALVVLRSFIVELYEEFNNLPNLPDEVKACLKSSKLSTFATRMKVK